MEKLFSIAKRACYIQLLMIFMVACSISPTLHSEAAALKESDYKIKPGDIIELKIENYPEFDQIIIVDSDGTASLKALGDMEISGLSPKGLKAILYEKYSYWLADPNIEISVRESKNFTVYIGGEVVDPGIVKFKGEITVAQCIILAGGLKDRSEEYEVLIFRNKGVEGVKLFKIDIKKNATGASSNRNFKLAPYDVVYVMKMSDVKANKGWLI